ncbi:MAG: HAD family hydrolase [Thaumarchaeota archaeon]|nr:MAG: HAD family hydrolase [Nitrososphaerota archaeon]
MRTEMRKRYLGLILDLDGCVYVDGEPTEGAIEALKKLRGIGVRILYVTNNPEVTSEDSASRLRAMGIECSPEEFLTVGEAVARYIASVSGPSKLLILTGRGVEEYCRQMGHRVLSLDEWMEAEYLVVGFDRKISYRRLTSGLRALLSGAKFIGTNPDAIHPGREGPEPGSGAFIAPFEYMTGMKPLIIGKPSRVIMELALRKLGMRADEVLVVGDRIDTDVKAGKAIGADTAITLTGITREEDLAEIPRGLRPTYVFRNLRDLVEKLYEQNPSSL